MCNIYEYTGTKQQQQSVHLKNNENNGRLGDLHVTSILFLCYGRFL